MNRTTGPKGVVPDKSIFFAFRAPPARYIAAIARGELPESFCYGALRFRGRGFRVLIDEEEGYGRFSKWCLTGLNLLAGKSIGVGFNPVQALRDLPLMNRADLVFTTVDSIGLPVLILKRLGLLKKPVIYQTVGLAQHFTNSNARWRIKSLGALLKQAEQILAFTRAERDCLVRMFNLPEAKITWIQAIPVIDRNFFAGIQSREGNYVLSVGRDEQRDFATLFRAAASLQQIPFVVVTRSGLVKTLSVPRNVQLRLELSYREALDLYAGARLVVLPLKNNVYSAGFRVLGEALALGKPVILSDVDALTGMDTLRLALNDCLVEPENPDRLAQAIAQVYADENLQRRLAEKGRRIAAQIFDLDYYVHELSRIFESFV